MRGGEPTVGMRRSDELAARRRRRDEQPTDRCVHCGGRFLLATMFHWRDGMWCQGCAIRDATRELGGARRR